MPSSQSWQDSLNPKLANRLARPLMRPGFIDLSLGYQVVERSHRFNQRLPLLDYVGRHQPSNPSIPSAPPIVYATSVIPNSSTIDSSQIDSQSAVMSRGGKTSKSLPVVQPIQSPVSTAGDILIQRKMASQPEAKESAQGGVVPKTIQTSEAQTSSSTFQASPKPFTPEMHPFETSLAAQALENPLQSLRYDISPTTSSELEFQRKISFPQGVVESLPPAINGLLVVQGKVTQAKSTSGTDPYVPKGRSQRQHGSTAQDVDLAKSAQKLLTPNPTKSQAIKATPFTRALPTSTTERIDIPHQQVPAAPMEPKKGNVELTTLVTAPGYGTVAAQLAETITRQNRDSPVQSPSVPRVTASIVPKPLTTSSVQSEVDSVSAQTVNAVDIDQLVDKVERKLMRRLVVERERRGQKR